MSLLSMVNKRPIWGWSVRGLKILVASAVIMAPIAVARHLVIVNSSGLQQQIRLLNRQIETLKQEQAMPVVVLSRYRDSVCYVFGIYTVGFDRQAPIQRARISGSGFLVAPNLIATNRHVAEPWYGDPEAERLIAKGATPFLEKLIAYFPGSSDPIDLGPAVVSTEVDLAVVTVRGKLESNITAVPVSSETPYRGESVAVIGYPLGVIGMAAKSTNSVEARLASKRDALDEAGELAAHSLIRPSATFGHIGDVLGTKLVYDAPTAHGASGGPVFNSRGEVVGINTGFIDGVPGGSFAVSSEELAPLIEKAQKKF